MKKRFNEGSQVDSSRARSNATGWEKNTATGFNTGHWTGIFSTKEIKLYLAKLFYQ